MFNKKKIFSNHVRASQNKNKKAKKFFSMIYNILIDKCSSYNSIKSSDVILELAARNDVLINTLNSRRIFPYFYKTVLTSSVKIKNKNVVVSELENQTFLNSSLNKCFCILSINNSTKIPLVFQNVYNVLKEKGIFISVFPTEECLNEFRFFFLNYFKPKVDRSFSPILDIQTIGNIGTSVGFKNVVVDKEKFFLDIKTPEEIWTFIRDIGESNSLINNKEFFIKKSLYKDFYSSYYKEIKKKSKNTFSFYFFLGTK